MNAIFQMLNPSNTLTVNRLLAHAIGLSEAVIYAALISKCSYYERNGMLDDGGWFYSTVPDLEASTALSEYQQKRCIFDMPPDTAEGAEPADRPQFHISLVDIGLLTAVTGAYIIHKIREKRKQRRL